MTAKFYVEVNPTQSECLQLVAFANGYSWMEDKVVKFTDAKYLYFHHDGYIKKSDSVAYVDDAVLVSFKECINILLGKMRVPCVQTFNIGGTHLRVSRGKLIAGCTEVPPEQVEEIYKAFKGA